ncbi:MAG TPA: hypothetical protein VIC33_00070 [Vicinamibacterales bacterium]|jgi:hypothetical protein
MSTQLPADFAQYLTIDNAAERFDEARWVAARIEPSGVALRPNLDHAAIFTDPPHLVAGPLKRLGYVSGWDARCYPSPVDGHDYINVSARLPEESPRRAGGWFDFAAIVHPVDVAAREHMLGQGYGNPFIHHLTWGIAPPERTENTDAAFAGRLVQFMAQARRRMADALGEQPGTLIMALPPELASDRAVLAQVPEWVSGLPREQYQVEAMEGGGFLLQFFVLTGGRIEMALRVGTRQTFNPRSVQKISRDEISAVQTKS